jgi:hypothetical protein
MKSVTYVFQLIKDLDFDQASVIQVYESPGINLSFITFESLDNSSIIIHPTSILDVKTYIIDVTISDSKSLAVSSFNLEVTNLPPFVNLS